MKNRTLAIIGIVVWVLVVVVSAEDLEGNPIFPSAIQIIPALGVPIFAVIATIRLWRIRRWLSLFLALSGIIVGALTIAREIAGINPIMLINLFRVLSTIAYIWTTVVLFRRKD